VALEDASCCRNDIEHLKLHNLYFSRDFVKVTELRIRWTVYVACIGYILNTYKIFVGGKAFRIPYPRWGG
jgi:hypothetical protein